ncbi:protein fluG [Aspergillus unguis]
MDLLTPLRRLIQTHPLIDNHAHNLLSKSAACDYGKYPFEQIISEAQGTALNNASSTLPFHRAASQLATLYQSSSTDWHQLKAARDQIVQRDYEGLIRQCLEGTQVLLLDDLLTDQDIEPFDWHDRFTASSTKRIVRIESIAAQVLKSLLPTGTDSSDIETIWGTFSREFGHRISDAIKDPTVVGFKSVICYRTGLDVQATEDRDTKQLLESFARTVSQATESAPRVEDKPLNDWLVRQTLNLLKSAKGTQPNKPLQLHTGLGDNDINLLRSNPAHLQDLIAQYPEVDFVLLHSSYPYTREAGYLACVYPNAYLDLGEVFPMVSRDAQESIVRESLEIVPTTRLLWSTDGHFFPETYWLANKQFRDVLEKVFVDYVHNGDYTTAQAEQAAVDILFYNSNRLYGLNEEPSSTGFPTTSLVTSSPTVSLEAFIRSNPDIKYVWMQFIDYTATVRLRMFPISEFAKIVRKQRRIGISLAVFWMLQDDGIAGGSTTGQFYMTPDLSTLSPNVGIDSKSATVMTWWKSDDGKPMVECPRTTLLNITNKLQDEFGIQATCGFEIEIVFLRPVTDPTTGEEDWEPTITNHSWSQMTRETRKLLPLLEEIVEMLASIGINLEQFHSESAPGQFEFILPPDSPVAAVDTLIKARQVITFVVEQHGLRATLHPRPYPTAAGTASHSHISISPPTRESSFLAGVLDHYPSVLAFTLSNDASYDRVKAGLWAGSEWVAWGTQNRESPIRKISPGHWEIKSLDGLANMYLAMSALLAAGYAGVKEDKELTVKDCQYDAALIDDSERSKLGITTKLPNTLAKSLSALESNKTLIELLGSSLVEDYIIVKRAESKKLSAMDEKARRKWLVERY